MERMNFLNCINNILPQMVDSTSAEGRTVKGLWASLSDWIGPTADPTERWTFFQNTGSSIARELESEIGRVNRLFLDIFKERSIDPASLKNKESNPFFAQPQAFGVGFK